jgi:acetylornithine deacetylase
MRMGQRQEAVLQYLRDREQETIDLLCDLVATSSANPPGDERAVTDLLLDRMDRLGLKGARALAREPERPNLLYEQPGAKGSPRLIFNGHTDTKPVGEEDRKLWRTDPMVPTLVDGKIYGLGTSDMKGGIAAMVYATAALRSLAEPPAGDLVLVLTANEEAPGEYGANWLARTHPLKADFCLVGDTGGIESDLDTLHTCIRNTVIFRVKVHGTQMHSSISDRFPSVNASVKMGWVIWRMSQALHLHYEPHPLYPKGPTVNLGDIVSGGLAYGTFSGYAEFGSDIRILPGMTRHGVVQDLEACLDQLRREDPELRVELEIVGGREERPWSVLKGDEPFVGIMLDACQQVLGRRPPLSGFPAFTDSYYFHTVLGIPALPAFGPGLLPLAHGPNECVSPQAVLQVARIYALAALEYLDA